MFYSTRAKLLAGFLGVTLLVGGVSLIIGVHLIDQNVFGEALNRVQRDLNAAHEMYLSRVKQTKTALSITTLGFAFITSVSGRNTADLGIRLERLSRLAELDFAGIVAEDGRTLSRMGPYAFAGPAPRGENPLAKLVLEQRVSVAGTMVLDRDFLIGENPDLLERARIPAERPPGGNSDSEQEEIGALVIAAAVPIFDADTLVGVLYGGLLLNRSEVVADTLRDTVFQKETYGGRSIGCSTVFLHDLRVATSVYGPEGRRALGTRASREVKEHVLDRGKLWADRAYVLGNWYIAAYRPMEDVFGRRVGMLKLGVLEEKFAQIRGQALKMFILTTSAGMLLAAIAGVVIARRITLPIQRLIKASQQVREGSLNPDLGPPAASEIGVLQKAFGEMVEAMGRRRAASELRVIQSEKQASVGRLAAGVAHEINNPLTGVLTYTHMLLRRKDILPEMRSDLQVIVEATERVRKIVKGLLDFSRQTKLDPEPTDVNRLVGIAISLIENQALVKGVTINFNPGENLPLVTLDRNQIQSVVINIIINALDATEPGGHIRIFTAASLSGDAAAQEGIEITFADTGCGIPAENLNKLFDPFFTTKGVGQGTGLGLSVSLGIVQRHGGHVRVQSEAGKGSRFFVWLPIRRRAEHESAGG
ncbi:MAG: cache domain-containing protein [Desulfobacterales bacterium]